MDNTITVNFRGLCTQMINDNTWTDGAPRPLGLRSEGREVAIRVFLANSELIERKIENPRYHPPRHHPAIRFETAMVSDDVRRYFPDIHPVEGAEEWWEARLPRIALEFRGVANSPAVIEESFKKLPSVHELTPDTHAKPKPRPKALDGFPSHAHVYVDLLTGFRIGTIDESEDVRATLTFDAPPELILKPHNIYIPGLSIPLSFGTIEIRNFPTVCGGYDYLLHYFATTTGLDGIPPMWPATGPGVCVPKQQARDEGKPPSPDVYCSSSGYP
jgi:hypothetical protein